MNDEEDVVVVTLTYDEFGVDDSSTTTDEFSVDPPSNDEDDRVDTVRRVLMSTGSIVLVTFWFNLYSS